MTAPLLLSENTHLSARADSAPPALVNTPVLETARLILRAPRLEDFEPYFAFAHSPRADWIGAKPDRALAWRSFGHQLGHWVLRGYGAFFLEPKAGGPVIGMVLNWFPEGWPEREIGWTMFRDDLEGQGYMTEAARAVLAHSWAHLGWETAVSYIRPENTRSAALARRLGAVIDPAATPVASDHPLDVWRHPNPFASATGTSVPHRRDTDVIPTSCSPSAGGPND